MPRLMIKPGGINIICDPALDCEVEAHSSTCRHCQSITDFPSRKVMFDYVDVCRGCMSLVCLKPECQAKGCVPFEKQAEQQEQEHRLRARLHMQAWGCY